MSIFSFLQSHNDIINFRKYRHDKEETEKWRLMQDFNQVDPSTASQEVLDRIKFLTRQIKIHEDLLDSFKKIKYFPPNYINPTDIDTIIQYVANELYMLYIERSNQRFNPTTLLELNYKPKLMPFLPTIENERAADQRIKNAEQQVIQSEIEFQRQQEKKKQAAQKRQERTIKKFDCTNFRDIEPITQEDLMTYVNKGRTHKLVKFNQHCFDSNALLQWISQNETNPMTRKKFTPMEKREIKRRSLLGGKKKSKKRRSSKKRTK